MHKYLKSRTFWLNKAIITAIIAILAFNVAAPQAAAAWSFDDVSAFVQKPDAGGLVMVIGGSSLAAAGDSDTQTSSKIIRAVLTAYSSTPDQTDDSPFITASNTHVRDGIVAANFLNFGTRIKIPSIFGDKIFTVEDRMARKNNGKIDIWFPARHLAKRFGIQEAEVEILD